MGEQSGINWTHHTYNPWIGCTKVSDGCRNCYAERMSNHRGWAEWGAGKPRRRKAESTRGELFKWNRKAEREGKRQVVFWNSLSDMFDPEVPDEWRDEAFAMMALTPWLNHVVLTKRVEEAAEYFQVDWVGARDRSAYIRSHRMEMAYKRGGPGSDNGMTWPLPNVWIGASICNQADADKHGQHLLRIAGMGWPTWVSYEPAIGPVDWEPLIGHGEGCDCDFSPWLDDIMPPTIKCIVYGGESGPGARPMHPDWAEKTRDACAEAGVVAFFKQWGGWVSLKNALERGINVRGAETHEFSEGILPVLSYRVGLKAAGRALDGVEDDPATLPWMRDLEVTP